MHSSQNASRIVAAKLQLGPRITSREREHARHWDVVFVLYDVPLWASAGRQRVQDGCALQEVAAPAKAKDAVHVVEFCKRINIKVRKRRNFELLEVSFAAPALL